MLTVYDIVDPEGTIVATLNSYEEAYEYMTVMNRVDCTIETRKVYTVKGLGRDPDLH